MSDTVNTTPATTTTAATSAPSVAPSVSAQAQEQASTQPTQPQQAQPEQAAAQTQPTQQQAQPQQPLRPTMKPSIRDRSVKELQKFYQKPIAKVSTELIITVVSVIFLALFAIRPTLVTMSTLLKDIDDKKKIDEQLTKKAAALSTANNELVPLKRDVALLNIVIPNAPDLDGALRRIEKIGSTRPLVLSSIQTDAVPKDKDPDLQGEPELTSFTVRVTTKGNYASLKDFLDAVLKIDRFISVDSITLNVQKTKKSTKEKGKEVVVTPTSPELQMTITLKPAYYGIPVEAEKKK